MKKIIVCILIMAASAFGETDKAQIDRFKKEAGQLQAAVEDAVNTVVTGQRGITEGPKAVYLEGYGIVVSLEVQIEPKWNPFSQKTDEEIKTTAVQRRKDLQAKLEASLKKHVVGMNSIASGESVTIVVHIFNSPVVVPDLPSQLILTAKKPEPATPEKPAVPVTVTLREY